MTESPASVFANIPRAIPLPEVAIIKNISSTVKASLGNLNETFNTLGNQIGQIALLGGDPVTPDQLNAIRKAMKSQDERHGAIVEEIRVLLTTTLRQQVEEHLRKQIENAVEDTVDEKVQEQVAASLETHIPQELQDEVTAHKVKLEQLRRALHNSESRRENALLKVSEQMNSLHTIYKTTGELSEHFPKTLIALSKLDAQTARILMEEYEIPNVSNSREGNINRFMLFCGIGYQVVPEGQQHDD